MIIVYFMFINKEKQNDKYNFVYRQNMFNQQRNYINEITKNMENVSDISEVNRPNGVFIIYYYDNFTFDDIENLKNNARKNGWVDVKLPNEDNIIYASCNENISLNIYKTKQLKVAIYWYRYDNYCKDNI